MIACPNCNHQNPEGASQCEACYTPLPALSSCPNCGAPTQADAHFCGQCGFNLKASATPAIEGETIAKSPANPGVALPDPLEEIQFDPLVPPDPLISGEVPDHSPSIHLGQTVEEPLEELAGSSLPSSEPLSSSEAAASAKTQLQTQTATLLHTRTNTTIEIPANIQVVHIGKPNNRIPPDIDVSGFPESEVVSRIHADIRLEGDAYYLEDVGSSNGTYVNNLPLSAGNRHRLRPGDRISLGKGDKVSFLFQIS